MTCNAWPTSIINVTSGILAGICYTLDIGSVSKLRFPKRLVALFSKPYTLSESTSRTALNDTQPTPIALNDPSTEEKIAQLLSMGFERDAVVAALARTEQNIERALNILISG